MANFHLAATAPINPPGAKPVLSREQVWRALQIKVREPSLFVPVITSCAVVSEKGNVVNREVQFKSGLGLPEGKISEACTNYAPAKVHFKMDTGDEVENIVGQGPSDDENDLWLTYAFDWVIKEGADTSQHGKVSFFFVFLSFFFSSFGMHLILLDGRRGEGLRAKVGVQPFEALGLARDSQSSANHKRFLFLFDADGQECSCRHYYRHAQDGCRWKAVNEPCAT